MSFLSIKDAPLKETIVGDEKIPTGGYGDLAITTQQLKDFTSLSFSNVDNTSDANKPVSVATQAALNLKANVSDVNTLLALKSDKTYVDDQLALKASKIYVDTELQKTASKTYVDNQLATKASTTYVDSINVTKATTVYVQTELDKKADSSVLETTITLSTATSTINTVEKSAGKFAFNNTDLKMYYATGTTPTSNWVSTDGTVTITPA